MAYETIACENIETYGRGDIHGCVVIKFPSK